MEPEHLTTQMINRLRQHFARRHKLLARDAEAEAMRDLSKRLLCPNLHAKPVDVEVCLDASNYYVMTLIHMSPPYPLGCHVTALILF